MVALSDFFDERGLLGLAFHPDYINNGRFFVRYSAPRAGDPNETCNDPKGFVVGCHTSVLSEFSVTGDPNLADPNSEIVLFTVDQPEFNHDAGTVAFGPDGMLYFSLGDGGGRDDGLSGGDPPGSEPLHGPIGNGQNIETALGSLLRIDVDSAPDPGLNYAIPQDNPFVGGAGLDEIYAYGFRNPFKFSFDDGVGGDGRLYLGDVGQDLFEEVNIVQKGGNYGWVIREGAHCFDPLDPSVPPASCDTVGPVLGDPLIDPVSEYLQLVDCVSDADCAALGVGCGSSGFCLNEGGISVIAGFVYRGSLVPTISGRFVYGDFSDDFLVPGGRLYYFDTLGASAFQRREFFLLPDGAPLGRFVKGFGEDENGELYVLVSDTLGPFGSDGAVLKIEAPTGACCVELRGVCLDEVTEVGCSAEGGRFGGNGSTCDSLDPPCEPVVSIRLQEVASGLTAPILATHAGDGSGRLFIVDQPGQIRILDAGGALLVEPFLDISDRIVELNDFFDERGLLGLAFHPQYAANGRFFVRYSAPRVGDPNESCNDPNGFVVGCHTAIVAEFSVSGDPNLADPDSERILFMIDEPEFNHDAGTVAFGPDGLLYFSLGDGGGRDDGLSGGEPPGSNPLHGPIGNGQDIDTALGALLRIDVDGAPDPGLEYAIPPDNPFVGGLGLDEIYAYGFRNPFKFSFDDGPGGDGTLYLGDVGQDLFEEVDVVVSGGNYGWVIREGAHCFDPLNPAVPPESCDTVGTVLGDPLIDPVSEYLQPIDCTSDAECAPLGVVCGSNGLCQNEGGISVIAGFVYRGLSVADLTSRFVYGDFSDDFIVPGGRLYYFDTTGPDAFQRREFFLAPDGGPLGRFVKGFGEDENGELYVMVSDALAPFGDTGSVLRIAPTALPEATGVSPRYLEITPPETAFPFGLVVTASCLGATANYVGQPSDPQNIALLVDNPATGAFLTSAEWGTVRVTGLAVVPNTTYDVQLDTGVPGAPVLSVAVSATTSLWGDVVGSLDPDTLLWTPPDGIVGITTDISSLIAAFSSRPGAPELFRADLVGVDNGIGCVPDQRIDIIFDITTAIDAFRGLSYEIATGCPGPCQ